MGERRSIQQFLSALVVAPSFLASLFFVYGFILWTGYLSLTKSKSGPVYEFAGFTAYARVWAQDRWHVAIGNLAIFAFLFILIALLIGIILAVLIDQRIRAEGVLRTIFLYPMAISFIVSGTAWRWLLNPNVGIQQFVRDLGFPDFTFAITQDPNLAVYSFVIAGVWQSAGFVMALFLAALRGVDQEIIRAAYLDGASLPRIYATIIIPSIRPVFLTSMVVLGHIAIKSFDLVQALTAGGPGYSSDLPANFMFQMTFSRGEMGMGAAAAMMMFFTVAAIMVPYLYSELKPGRRHG